MNPLNLFAKISLTLSVLSVLSGCFATMALHDKATQSDTRTQVHLSDTITHIGIPKKPLKDYPHALVMVGNKQSYLLTSPHTTRPSLLKDIFTQLDTSHLYIKPTNNPNAQTQNHYNISIHHHCHTQNKLCDTVWLHYQKPTAKLHKHEQSKLVNLGFDCRTTHQELICQQEVGFEIHLAQISANQNLPHRLKQPIHFQAVSEEYHTTTNKGLMLLTPVAVGIDIVTFPIQFLIISHWLKNK